MSLDLEASRREVASDPRSNAELVGVARAGWLAEEESAEFEAALSALWVIAARGTRDELELLLALSLSDEQTDREIAAFALGRLGYHTPLFLDETVPRLLELTHDSSPDVVETAVFALGQRGDASAVPRLVELAGSSQPELRFAVAMSLGSIADPRSDAALLALMEDPAGDVRNWATFGLGVLHESSDSPAIREALLRRTHDDDDETRNEALLGLALRRDLRVLDPLRAELRGALKWDHVFEAIGYLDDRSLLPDMKAAIGRLEADHGWAPRELLRLVEKWESGE